MNKLPEGAVSLVSACGMDDRPVAKCTSPAFPGGRSISERPTMHCCEEMDQATTRVEFGICYNPKFREYGIPILDGGSSVLLVKFCPWCGIRLPDSLRAEWFDRLEELGLEPEDEALPADLLHLDLLARRDVSSTPLLL